MTKGIYLFVANKYIETAISGVKPITNRILVVDFNGNPNTTIVINYVPTEGSDNTEEHYLNLSNTINSLPKQDLVKTLHVTDTTKIPAVMVSECMHMRLNMIDASQTHYFRRGRVNVDINF